jgi:glycosyltransferase involved in cell wall biosynthesis
MWFFAYTASGAQQVALGGFPVARVTTVQNAIDTRALRQSIAETSEEARHDFARAKGLTTHTAIYLGALDTSKRIDFLLEAAMQAHQRDPEFRLLIVGDGALRDRVQQFEAEFSWAHYLGALRGGGRALPMSVSKVLLMPGRVGLAIVDAFAAGLPTITTDWPLHAPEFEYLKNGSNGLVIQDNARSYGDAVAKLLGDPARLSRLSAQCRQDSHQYSLENMVDNFATGILEALEAGW